MLSLESTQSHSLDSRVHTGNDFHRRILAERLDSACSLDVLLQIHSPVGGTILTLLRVGVNQTLRRCTESATYIRQGGHDVGHWPTF